MVNDSNYHCDTTIILGMKTIILVPTYNERENILRLIPQIFTIAPDVQVMVIDDHSPDGTARSVEELAETYPHLTLYRRPGKEGLGRAYMDAFKKILEETDCEVICTMDADLSHDPNHLSSMLRAIETHDIVIGSRYVPGGSIIGWESWRKLLSSWGNRYCRLVTRIPIRDCTTGFTAMRASFLRKINFSDFDTSGYAFLIYLKYKFWKLGARMCEVPICFRNRITGESKISTRIIQEGLFLPWRLIKKPATATRPVCPLCNDTKTNFWFTKNNCDVYRCATCRLIFIYPIPTSIATVYSDDYFCGAEGGFGYINYDEDKDATSTEFKKYLESIERHYPSKGSLLDVGAATGSFLIAARERGWQVAGVEISPFAAQTGREKGIDLRTDIVEEAGFTENSFEVITLWDVFEHLPDPEKTLSYLRTLLKPNGLLVMNMPNADSMYAKLAGKHWTLIIPPEHLRLFNPDNLATLLTRNGFSMISRGSIGKRFKAAYIFQILYTIRHQKIWRKISDYIKTTPVNKLSIPINLKDNMFIIARKN